MSADPDWLGRNLFSVAMRFEWEGADWCGIMIEVYAFNRVKAAGKGLVLAQKEVEHGWRRVIVEAVPL